MITITLGNLPALENTRESGMSISKIIMIMINTSRVLISRLVYSIVMYIICGDRMIRVKIYNDFMPELWLSFHRISK